MNLFAEGSKDADAGGMNRGPREEGDKESSASLHIHLQCVKWRASRAAI